MRSLRPVTGSGKPSALLRRLAVLERKQVEEAAFVVPGGRRHVFDFVVTHTSVDHGRRTVFMDAKPRVRRSRKQEGVRHVDG